MDRSSFQPRNEPLTPSEEEINAYITHAQAGHLEPIVAFVEKYKEYIDITNGKGGTAFLLAADRGQFEILEFLLDHGSDVNQQNDSGYTALHNAVSWADQETMLFLLEHGADAEIKTKDGKTPLDMVGLIVKDMISANIDPEDVQEKVAFMTTYLETWPETKKKREEDAARQKVEAEAAMDDEIKKRQQKLKELAGKYKFKPRP